MIVAMMMVMMVMTMTVMKADAILAEAAHLTSTQDALLAVRQCAAYTRLVYATRVTPPALVLDELSRYSSLLRKALQALEAVKMVEKNER